MFSKPAAARASEALAAALPLPNQAGAVTVESSSEIIALSIITPTSAIQAAKPRMRTRVAGRSAINSLRLGRSVRPSMAASLDVANCRGEPAMPDSRSWTICASDVMASAPPGPIRGRLAGHPWLPPFRKAANRRG